MDQRKRDLKNAYKCRTVIGGVYTIRCGATGEVWLRASADLQGTKNRFAFSLETGSCPEPCVADALRRYGPECLTIEVLEELEKGELQTDREFSGDIDTLLGLWREKTEKQEGGAANGTGT